MANVAIVHLGFMIDGIPSPCHIWQGSHSGDGRGGGYPRMSLDGQTVAVHIVSFTNKNGFVPGKKQIDHMCNNRLCVNEEHLQMVTHRKNQKLRDLRRKEGKTDVCKNREVAFGDYSVVSSDESVLESLRRAGLSTLGHFRSVSEPSGQGETTSYHQPTGKTSPHVHP